MVHNALALQFMTIICDLDILNVRAIFAVMNSFYLLISSSENKAWKKKKKEEKIQACTGFECLTSAIPVQSSANWANKPTWSCWWINVCVIHHGFLTNKQILNRTEFFSCLIFNTEKIALVFTSFSYSSCFWTLLFSLLWLLIFTVVYSNDYGSAAYSLQESSSQVNFEVMADASDL